MTVSAVAQVINVGGHPDNKAGPSSSKSAVKWFAASLKIMMAEFVSTTLLLFLGCMGNIPLDGFTIQPPMYGAITFGLVVLFNITSFGHISGAHMNPSVTLSSVIYGKVSIPLAILYLIAQCGGAIAGYGLLMVVAPIDLVPGSVCTTLPHSETTEYQALLTEVILSAALGFINCAVWDPLNEEKNEANSLKFGFTIAALSLAGGPLTGASMNPARSLGPALWTWNWTAHWVYWVGPIIGGAFSPIFYKCLWLGKSGAAPLQVSNGQI